MQIISQSEALRRLNSEDNLLNKLGRRPESSLPPSISDGATSELVEDSEATDEVSGQDQLESIAIEAADDSAPALSETHNPSPERLLQSVLEIVDEDGKLPPKYRGQRGKEMPAILRAMVGVEAHHDRNQNVAVEYGISPAQVSEYKRGHVGGKADESLQSQIESELGAIRKIANKKLKTALNLINRGSLGECSAVELATIAKSMSAIVQNSIPAHLKESKKEEDPNSRAQFVVVVPQTREESAYKQIEVGG